MSDDFQDAMFVGERRLSGILGLKLAWIKKATAAKEIPFLQDGKTRMYDHALVAAILRDKQAKNWEGTHIPLTAEELVAIASGKHAPAKNSGS